MKIDHLLPYRGSLWESGYVGWWRLGDKVPDGRTLPPSLPPVAFINCWLSTLNWGCHAEMKNRRPYLRLLCYTGMLVTLLFLHGEHSSREEVLSWCRPGSVTITSADRSPASTQAGPTAPRTLTPLGFRVTPSPDFSIKQSTKSGDPARVRRARVGRGRTGRRGGPNQGRLA